MKGHTLPGINQRIEGKNKADGRAKSSAFQVAGAFITDIDELTGEETTKRATYKDTRKAEKEGKKVTYTNKEDAKRVAEEVENLKTQARESSAKGKTEKSDQLKSQAEQSQKMLKKRQDVVRKKKMSEKEQQERKDDAAFQAQIEREANVKARKKKGDKSQPKTLTREQRAIVTGKKDTNKPGKAGTKTTVDPKSGKMA